MMFDFHFLRPWWFLALIPMLGLVVAMWKHSPRLQGWAEICDERLLAHLIQKKGQNKRIQSVSTLFISLFFMILSLSGPTWHQYPVASYKPVMPQVVLLDMSESMLENDLTPDRLSRAKFKLHDVLSRKDVGQFGMLVFTGEPFVVSPLTDDGQTIDALLSSLTPEVMPVGGSNLVSALHEASQLIHQAGYNEGDILVLTADVPASKAIEKAQQLAGKGIYTSIMPMRAGKDLNPLFERFANAGKGQLLIYSPDSSDLNQWVSRNSHKQHVKLGKRDEIPVWRDEGRWLLIPALFFLLPAFRRGWLQRIEV